MNRQYDSVEAFLSDVDLLRQQDPSFFLTSEDDPVRRMVQFRTNRDVLLQIPLSVLKGHMPPRCRVWLRTQTDRAKLARTLSRRGSKAVDSPPSSNPFEQ